MSNRHFLLLISLLLSGSSSIAQVIYQSPSSSLPSSSSSSGIVYGAPIPGSERIIREWTTTVSPPTPVTTSRQIDSIATRPHSPVRALPSQTIFDDRTNPRSQPSTRLKDPVRPDIRQNPANFLITQRSESIAARNPVLQTSSRAQTSWEEPLIEARRTQYDFRSIAADREILIAEIADQNAVFVGQWIEAYEALDGLTQRVYEAEKRVQTTTLDLEDADAKLKQYGLTPTIGLLLRHKKEQLGRWRASDETIYSNQVLADIREQQLALELIIVDGSRPFEQAAELLEASGIPVEHRNWQSIRNRAADLLRRRFRWINQLRNLYSDYHTQLGRLESAKQILTQVSADYRRLIDRHIIWIRSGETIKLADFGKLDDAAEALFASSRSDAIGATIGRKWQSNRAATVTLILWITLLAALRWRLKSWLLSIGNSKALTRRSKEVRLAAAGGLTVAISTILPAMLLLISRWLADGIVTNSTLYASSGAAAAALAAFAIELPRHALRNFGLFDRHIDIELPDRGRAVTYLTIIGFGFVLAAYIVTLSSLTDRGTWRDSFSRIGFIVTMLLVAWTAHRALRPVGGLTIPMLAKFGGSMLHRIRFVLYLFGVAMPIGLSILSSIGYGYSASEILRRSMITWIAAVSVALFWPALSTSCSHVWRLLTGTVPPPREFDEYGEINPATEDEGHVSGHLATHFLELKHQLAFMCQCGLVVLAIASGGWLWWDVVPMAEVGNPVLWTVTETQPLQPTGLWDVSASDEDFSSGVLRENGLRDIRSADSGATRWVSQSRDITVLHLALAVGTLFVAFQLAKLLPALYDALVLQRVSFDEAMEHFTFVLCRFALFSVGILIACHLVGLRWQTVQWLAVGLMVGLGFGLQDVIRNLMGGLVVLFEKPAKLGDRISIGKLTGRVAMQKLRTTVLADDEGREVIVPNKNFMSDEVINHMGSGRLQAAKIEVAVHRDERPADVCRLLTEWMIEQPEVLLTPAPQATLVCVGQSSQRIEVQAWIEEDQNLVKFRDSMLAMTRRRLRDAELLAKNQPKQPSTKKDDPDGDEEWMRAA